VIIIAKVSLFVNVQMMSQRRSSMPKLKLPVIPNDGNFMFIIKPEDTLYAEGKVLASLPTVDMLTYGVGGLIEIVPGLTKFGGRPCIAFCNEEGKLYGLPPNHLAHMLWEQNLGRIITEDQLVGNIVIVVGSPSFLRRM
jgi:hypothetical protein